MTALTLSFFAWDSQVGVRQGEGMSKRKAPQAEPSINVALAPKSTVIAFHMMHQSARKTIFPLTREKRIGTLHPLTAPHQSDIARTASGAPEVGTSP
jgi:hypothetical protein